MDKIKELREKTGAGLVDIKKALEEAQGNETEAIEILRKKGQDKALKKSQRETKEGLVVSYVHSNNKVGSLVKLFCETDFAARNAEFQELAKDIAMHVTAMDPKFLRPEDVTPALVEKEKNIWIEQLKTEKKPEEIIKKILAGKEKKFREDISLLSQPFVKDPGKTVGDLIVEKIGKIGENIQIGDFIRYEL